MGEGLVNIYTGYVEEWDRMEWIAQKTCQPYYNFEFQIITLRVLLSGELFKGCDFTEGAASAILSYLCYP